MDPMAMTSRLVSVATLGVFCAFTAAASPIAVANFSFETTPAPNGFDKSCVIAKVITCVFSSSSEGIPDWTSTGTRGELRPVPGDTTIFNLNTIPDGVTVGFAGGTLAQVVGATVHPGYTYILMVDLGIRKDIGNAVLGGADLLIGTGTKATTIIATGQAPGPGGWALYTATYVGLTADIGKSITIQLTSPSAGQAEFDNVQLSAVPEPAGVTLLGLGLAGLLVFARRQRAS